MKSSLYPYTWYNPTKGELLDSGIEAPIAFDMDGVLAETGGILQDGIKAKYGVDDIRLYGPGYELFSYHVMGVEQRDMFNAVNDIIGEESDGALPTPFMQDCLDYFYEVTDEPITIVTARVKDNMDVTYKWLTRNLNVPFNLIMVNGMQKEVVLKRIGCSMFVDDRYKTIKRLEDHIEFPILYKRDWNQNRPEPAGRFTITDLRDMIPVFNIACNLRPMTWPGNIPYPNRLGREGIEYA